MWPRRQQLLEFRHARLGRLTGRRVPIALRDHFHVVRQDLPGLRVAEPEAFGAQDLRVAENRPRLDATKTSSRAA